MSRFSSIVTFFLFPVVILAADRKIEIRFNQRFYFNIGDNSEWADPDFDHSDWDNLRASRPWEEQGYPGYDGYAWYRFEFELKSSLQNKALILDLGFIDDVDRVWLNGQYLNGRGSLPPEFKTAYNQRRTYELPRDILRFEEKNILAIQVYDEEGVGGLVGGRIGILSEHRLELAQDLSGTWEFRQGDDTAWKQTVYDDSDWKPVRVPGTWDSYGYGDYDGYGWFRKTFVPSNTLKDHDLILALGKIDDIDEVYLNGVRIGRTGRFPGEKYLSKDNQYWHRDRFYYVRPQLIQWGQENVIAVRVYDVFQVGGIYSGPIGLLKKKDFLAYRERKRNTFADFLRRIFEGWE